MANIAFRARHALAAISITLIFGFASVLAKPKNPRPSAAEAQSKLESSLGSNPSSPSGPRLDPNGYPLPPGAINRIGSNLYRHYGAVSRLLYTPDAKSLACTSWDGYVHLWNTT